MQSCRFEPVSHRLLCSVITARGRWQPQHPESNNAADVVTHDTTEVTIPQVKVGTFRLLRYAAQDWQYMAIGAVASGIIGLQVSRSSAPQILLVLLLGSTSCLSRQQGSSAQQCICASCSSQEWLSRCPASSACSTAPTTRTFATWCARQSTRVPCLAWVLMNQMPQIGIDEMPVQRPALYPVCE